MIVRIRRLRHAGRPIPDHEASRPEHVAHGDLTSVGTRYELRKPMTMNAPPLAVLYDGRVLSIRSDGMLIRGIEECRGAAVLQEWEVSPLERTVGADGLSRWKLDG